MKLRGIAISIAGVCLLFVLPICAKEPAGLRSSTQLLVVTTADWNSVAGRLQRFERGERGEKWKAVGAPIDLVVAKKGLAWGTGVAGPKEFGLRSASDPVKREGDTRAPAGLFRLGTAFGYAAEKPAGWKMPYVSLTPTIECVDDARSKYYNRIVDRAAVTPDWNSSEHMLYSNGQYRWGLVIEHNMDPVVAGAGSCIFMHIWLGTGEGTVGCTAMAEDKVEPVIGWIDPARNPLLLQLPRGEYEKVRGKWRLPKVVHSAGR